MSNISSQSDNPHAVPEKGADWSCPSLTDTQKETTLNPEGVSHEQAEIPQVYAWV